MGNINENVDKAYNVLVNSKNILPDNVCVQLIQLGDVAVYQMLQQIQHVSSFNETSIGNILAIMRAFPYTEKEQKLGKTTLKLWLNYVHRNNVSSETFKTSPEIYYALKILYRE